MIDPYASCPSCKSVAIDVDSVERVFLLVIARLNEGSPGELRRWQEDAEATFQQMNPDLHKALSDRSTMLRTAFSEATHQIETVDEAWQRQALSMAEVAGRLALVQCRICGSVLPTGQVEKFAFVAIVVFSAQESLRATDTEEREATGTGKLDGAFVPARMN